MNAATSLEDRAWTALVRGDYEKANRLAALLLARGDKAASDRIYEAVYCHVHDC